MTHRYDCCVYLGDKLAAYGFGNNHPFGPQRHHVFEQAFYQQSLHEKVAVLQPQSAEQNILETQLKY